MKRALLLATTFIISITLFSQVENSLLWKIEGKGIKKTSYLYGTIHVDDERVFFLMDEINTRLDKCKYMAGEIDMEEESSNPMAIFGQMQMEGTKLEDLYTEEEYEYVKAELKDHLGPMFMMIENFKPIFISVIISESSALRESNGDVEIPVVLDDKIQSNARLNGKKVFGLETAEEALAALDGITYQEQAQMLYDELKKLEEKSIEDYLEQITQLYLNQDLQGMVEFSQDEGMSANLEFLLVDERNRKFVDGLMDLMHKKPTFCAVGAMHLPGETGMIELLRAEGLTVEPINVGKE